MPKAHALTQRKPTRMKTPSLLLLAAVLGSASLPVFSQSAPAPASRLCTAGFNNDYGWFQSSGKLGAIDIPGLTSSNCTPATGADLKISLGGINLPLEIVNANNNAVGLYNLGSTPSTFEVMLLEPAICEDYHTDTGGSNQWKLRVRDINNDFMFDPVKGISTLSYNLATGLLTPNGNDKLRCYSGLAGNADLTQTTGSGASSDPSHIFSDGMEPLTAPINKPDLRVRFLDMNDNPLDAVQSPAIPDLIEQTKTGDIQFKVEVTNIGAAPATEVRIRELFPTTTTLLAPTVTASATCLNTGSSCNAINPSSPSAPINDQLTADLDAGQSRTYTLTRQSSGITKLDQTTDTSDQQPMALIQVAAFSDPTNGETDHTNNSRTLRIKLIDKVVFTYSAQPGGSITVSTNGQYSNYNCSPKGTETIECDPGATGLVFTAEAVPGNSFTQFSGSCTGTTNQTTPNEIAEFTTTSSASCGLVAEFKQKPTVTVSVSENGSTTKTGANSIHYGTAFEFQTTANAHHSANVSGCSVHTTDSAGTTSLVRNWKIDSVTGTCTVNVNFMENEYTVDIIANTGGKIAETESSSLKSQLTRTGKYSDTPWAVSFIIVPDAGNTVDTSSITNTCGGTWELYGGTDTYDGSRKIWRYRGKQLTSNCDITVDFKTPRTMRVKLADSNNGFIGLTDNPSATSDLVFSNLYDGGPRIEFYAKPKAGEESSHHAVFSNTSGSCSFTTLDQTTYGWKSGLVNGDCETKVSFAINEYEIELDFNNAESTGPSAQDSTGALYFIVDNAISGIEHGQTVFINPSPKMGWTFNLASTNSQKDQNAPCDDLEATNFQGWYKFTNPITKSCKIKLAFTQ